MQSEEDNLLKNRFAELARRASQQNRYLFTGFLGLGEQALFYQAASQFSPSSYTLYGGEDFCERRMARFGNPLEIGYEEPFPISCLCIRQTAPKFAEALTHRDYLGALVHLGVERSVLGDILPAGHSAYIYCQDGMASFICENLSRVKHTAVEVRPVQKAPADALPCLKEQVLAAASERLDVLLCAVWNLSRSQSAEAVNSSRVFVNGRLCENSSMQPKAGDIVTLRGYGRFVYDGVVSETKKGRFKVSVKRYQ